MKYTNDEEEDKVASGRLKPTGHPVVGGVLFLDEAYDLEPAKNKEGAVILAELMSAAEEYRDSLSIILAGYKKEIERNIFAHNPDLLSRFTVIPFEDYTETQLVSIWRKMCRDHDWLCDEDVAQVAGRRVSRGGGVRGFGNARAVRTLFERAVQRAKLRVLKEGAAAKLVIEDVLGERPVAERVPALARALAELDGMIGLALVKAALHELVRVARNNYDKELRGEPIDELVLHRVFLGNPGTGKTTVAKLYGRILKELNLLSNGEVELRTASDFTGAHIGHTPVIMRGVLEIAEGKVLLIDEAYNPDDSMGINNGAAGYGSQALNVLVERTTGQPGEDLAIIMCGCKAPMLAMFRNQNPGLTSRFNPNRALHFDDYSDGELLEATSRFCRRINVRMPLHVKRELVDRVSQLRRMPNFGNVRVVEQW